MNDRNDDLSTADLAGQSAGSGTADERAVRGEPAGRTGERDDAFPGDRSADADYADDRSGVGRDRVDGMGSGGFPGGTPADRAAYADDDPTMTTDGAERGGYGGGQAGAEVAGGPMADDGRFAGGRGGDGADRGYHSAPTGTPAGTGTGAAGTGAAGTGAAGTGAAGTGAAGTGAAGTGAAGTGPLLDTADTEGFRARWTDVQTGFVDAPRRSVEQADALVAELMQHLAKSFADERSRLESQWDRGEDIPTDDLRDAFQRYRSFFERLLST